MFLAATLIVPTAGAVDVTSPYPVRPIRLIVPFAPGGGTDIVSRTIAQRLTENLTQTVVVDNRPGGGGTVGAEIVVNAVPDGYTLILGAANYATNAALHKLRYDPVKDITPISLICETGSIVVLHPTVPIKSVAELIAYAKAKPGALNYGSSGSGGLTHFATELFDMMAGTRMTHVAYRGSGPALIDLLAGQIQIMFGSMPSTLPHLKTNRLRAIAVTTASRTTMLPELPAVSEAVPGYEALSWYAVWGPKNLPKNIVTRWNSEIRRLLQLNDVRERMAGEALQPVGGTPEQFQRTLQNDIAKWIQVVRRSNLKAGE
jgi:tripartite-type tricarboxylate transporter receptor subunit TctC